MRLKQKVLILLILLVSLTPGCWTARSGSRTVTHYWDLSYKETLLVNTEPQGAKIYCQDEYVGISPVKTETRLLEEDAIHVVQTGTYPIKWEGWDADIWGPAEVKNKRRTGPTKWSDKLQFSSKCEGGTWIIKAFKDGYKPAIYTITFSCNDNAFREATRKLKPASDRKLPATIIGSRTVLLTLTPLTPIPPVSGHGAQQQQQQQTVVMPGGEQGKIGKVILTSNVENADVFVDGVFVGNTPANLKLKDGIHIIEVKKDGYKTYKRELRVLEGSESSLRVLLVKE